MSLLPAKYNFQVWAGGTFSTTLTLYTGPTTADPWDLTGYSADCQINNLSGLLYELSTANSKISLGGDLGTVTLTIPAVDTSMFDWQRGVYTLYLTGTDETIYPVLTGLFIIRGPES